MKTGFPNPIEPKKSKTVKSPVDFSQPPYDQRTSCYANAGSHYGQGKKQPVGEHRNATLRAACLPFGRVNTMQVTQEPPLENLPIDIEK